MCETLKFRLVNRLCENSLQTDDAKNISHYGLIYLNYLGFNYHQS
jgi:hypothetical protein